jgi:hypothetical protein
VSILFPNSWMTIFLKQIKGHLHDITPIVSLKIGLERVDTAQASLLV